MSEQLKLHRDQIDAIDEQLLTLVNERAALARKIGSLKDDGVIYRPEREAQVLRRRIEREVELESERHGEQREIEESDALRGLGLRYF